MQNVRHIVISVFALTILIPLVVANFVYPSHVPPNFLVFPPVEVPDIPGFNLIYFTVLSLGGLAVTIFIAFPSLFGFKKVSVSNTPASNRKLPWWFYVGLVFMLFFWWLHWSRSFIFGDLVYYAFSPMWWGFIFVLDGIVYYRTGGKSLWASRRPLFLICSAFSVGGWFYFEYFDYFVQSNWYYPFGQMSELPRSVIILIFLVAYSTVWPAIFEWYTLLNTFPKFVARYSEGFKLPINGNLLSLFGVLVMIGFVAFPHLMFWGIWIGPMAMMVGQFLRLNVWTPYLEITKHGNWSPAILIALASLLNGFFWEFWNHGSEAYNLFNSSGPIAETNPNFWIYNVPYVNVIHIFSEMPLLGYFGYLPFGLLVWVMYIAGGQVFGWRTDLRLNDPVK